MTYRRIGAALVLLLALVRPLYAQQLYSGTITAQDAGSCATANACLTFQLPTGVTALLFQVSGTFSGTLTFEATADPATASTQTWFSLGVTKGSDGTFSTTTTGTGQFSAAGAGALQVRVRAGSFASGTATISLNRGYFVSRLMYPIYDTVTANAFVGGTFTTGTTGRLSSAGLDLSTTALLLGTALGTNDARIRRTATKTIAVDDGAGGALTDVVVTGPVTASGQLQAGVSSAIRWNGSTRMAATYNGGVAFTDSANGHAYQLQFSNVPTCPTNCGTLPSLAGNDSSVTVTMGATGSPASGFVITFDHTWGAAPQCHATMALAGMAAGKLPLTVVTTTTTATVVTNGTAPANGDKYHITCSLGS